MILQNISKAIREQNYYAVALEFVIVIAGVVIGFQIQAWNATRQANVSEGRILERLITDFRAIEASALSGMDNTVGAIDAIDEIASMAGTQIEDTLLDDLASLVNTASVIQARAGDSATYSELVATGQLLQISSVELRSALQGFEYVRSAHESSVPVLLDVATQNGELLLAAYAVTSAPPDRFGAELQRVIDEPDFYQDAMEYRLSQAATYGWLRSNLIEARNVLGALGEQPLGGEALSLEDALNNRSD